MTTTQIKGIREAAGKRGDFTTVELCDIVLSGVDSELCTVSQAIEALENSLGHTETTL